MDIVIDALKNVGWAAELKDWAVSIAIGLSVVWLIHTFIAEPYIVDGSSMNPTLQSGERVMVNKFTYRIDEPKKSDIIVFEQRGGKNRNLIKRIIATGGDTIEVANGKVYVNDQLLDEDYILETTEGDYFKTVVPEGTVFVMGDNRNNSLDSRFESVGFVEPDDIKGKANVVFWPITSARGL